MLEYPVGLFVSHSTSRLPSFVLSNIPCTRHSMGLLQADSGEMERGAYVDASPTVGDLDGDGRLEVLVGTVSGGLHVIDARSG